MNPISICLIAKNEEANIDACLSALTVLDGEIILVDTGSTDRTIELAKKYTQNIFDFTWINDFSAARNFSIKQATFDWILVIDCDEYLEDLNLDLLLEMMKQSPYVLGQLKRNSIIASNTVSEYFTDYPERFFHKNNFHYEDSIHEQVRPLFSGKFMTQHIPLTVKHNGYIGEEKVHAKSMRNITLLKKRLHLESKNPYIYFQIGQAYYGIQDYNNALSFYQKAFSLPLNRKEEYVQLLVCGILNCMNELHMSKEALDMLQYYDDFSDYADFVLLAGHVYANASLPIQALSEYIKATTVAKCHKQGSNTYLPFYYMGNLYVALGDTKMACMMYQKCGDYEPAIDALKLL